MNGYELEEKVHNEKVAADDNWELSKVDKLVNILTTCKSLESKIDLLLNELHETKQSTMEIKSNLLHIVDIIDPEDISNK